MFVVYPGTFLTVDYINGKLDDGRVKSHPSMVVLEISLFVCLFVCLRIN